MTRASILASIILALAAFCLADSIKKPTKPVAPIDNELRVQVAFSDETSRFGVVCAKLKDSLRPGRPKFLTRDERGNTNNTCIVVGGSQHIFGFESDHFRYCSIDGVVQKSVPVEGSGNRKWFSMMDTDKPHLRITQTIEILKGEQTQLYDTVLIKYQVKNQDTKAQTVGLRMILDTYIGSTDGVPFHVAASDTADGHWVTTKKIFLQKAIPDFIRAIECSDASGVVAELCPKLPGSEPLSRLVLCRWPDFNEIRFDWEYQAMNDPPKRDKDSCAALFWEKMQINPGDVRTLAFTYGLGRIPVVQSGEYVGKGKLRLLTSPHVQAGQPFVVTAYIKGERGDASIALPDGLVLVNEAQAKKVPAPPAADTYSQVSWKVLAKKPGGYAIKVNHKAIGTAEVGITVQPAKQTAELD